MRWKVVRGIISDMCLSACICGEYKLWILLFAFYEWKGWVLVKEETTVFRVKTMTFQHAAQSTKWKCSKQKKCCSVDLENDDWAY